MKYPLSILAILVLIAASCGPAIPVPHEEMNGAYYWKTVFNPDSAELDFMSRHKISRLYLRMFDVSVNDYASDPDNRAVPNATVRIGDAAYRLLQNSLKRVEFVPVVYITLDALKAMDGREDLLASNIVTRVRNMCQYNGLPNVSELQLDCDWTGSTETPFFRLCDEVKRNISELQLPWRLSSTIRLHQLSQKVPPVDNGVLMVYNTGNFNDPDTRNSIIDPDEVKPYLKHLPEYKLHLDVAYPTYSWQLLFRKRHFMGLMKGVDLSDSTLFRRQRENEYVVRADTIYNGRNINEWDVIRVEKSNPDDIQAVKNLIEAKLKDRPHSTILYHIDSKNLSNYTSDEITEMLSTAD